MRQSVQRIDAERQFYDIFTPNIAWNEDVSLIPIATYCDSVGNILMTREYWDIERVYLYLENYDGPGDWESCTVAFWRSNDQEVLSVQVVYHPKGDEI
jgi:hypothetical protein